jgi:uncharacterized protein YceH (UPF0502 family)
MTDQTEEKLTELPRLDRRQRRVLGVLIEKGMTTPEYYPLTLKAATSGCNQKSNRDPVTSYDEDTVLETLDSLQELRLTGTVHTEGGRAERYRPYLRHRIDITEPQLAILGELLLRGRQQLGELRSRASRMVPIESLDELREELKGLMAMGAAHASGDLARRGIEVDHALYLDSEPESNFGSGSISKTVSESPTVEAPSAAPAVREESAGASDPGELQAIVRQLQAAQQLLTDENRELSERVEQLQEELREVADQLDDLKRQLGA